MQWRTHSGRNFKGTGDEETGNFLRGDLNVAHQEIDLKNPKTNRKNAGFSDEERAKFTELLEAGFVDTFRYFYPGSGRDLLLVVLPVLGKSEEHGVADRLLRNVQKVLKDRLCGREDPYGSIRQRSLSGWN